MTKSTITREESVQAVFDLKVGYRLGFADIEILKRVARMALAAMDSEPVALHMSEAINVFNALKIEQLSEHMNNARLGPMGASNVQVWTSKAGGRLEFISANGGCTLNIFPHPAPVVPAVSDDIGEIRVGRLPTMNQDDYPGLGDWWVQLRIGEDSDEVLARVYGATPQEANNRAEALACRAAMLHAGNPPVIPDGYVMVPKEATLDMLKAGAKQEMKGEAFQYVWQAMLAAAPQSPSSELATVPGKWIPVSERMPEDRISVILWDAEIGEVTSGHYSHKTQTFYHCGDAIENEITHWMPLPAGPQEVR
ncbi:TPA: DUF551 domain-containing protein [Klebsiella pneumoniae]